MFVSRAYYSCRHRIKLTLPWSSLPLRRRKRKRRRRLAAFWRRDASVQHRRSLRIYCSKLFWCSNFKFFFLIANKKEKKIWKLKNYQIYKKETITYKIEWKLWWKKVSVISRDYFLIISQWDWKLLRPTGCAKKIFCWRRSDTCFYFFFF